MFALMNHLLRNSVVFAPEGGSGFGSFAGGMAGQQAMSQQPDKNAANTDNSANGGTGASDGADDDESEDSGDLAQLMAMFDDVSDDDDTSNDSDGSKRGTGADGDDDSDSVDDIQQQLSAELQDGIRGIGIREDTFPEDFDPTDQRQLRAALASAAQQTAIQTIRLALRPMQVAMQQMRTQMMGEIQNRIKEYSQTQTAASILEQHVPEIRDPTLAPMVRMLDKQAKARGLGSLERAKNIRKALDQLGITRKVGADQEGRGTAGATGSGMGNDSNGNGRVRQGRAALDLFMPLPKK